MKQTAVEWLVKELNQKINFIPMDKWDEIKDIVQEAKEMEKEQIIKAYDESNKLLCLKCTDFITGIKYYNETFKNKMK